MKSRILTTLLLLSACGGEPAAPPATAPSTPAAPAAEAPPSPDGPADLTIPSVSPLLTGPEALARGEAVYAAKGCAACHAFGSRLVGPDLAGVGDRRTPAWLARMIRHPMAMTKRDPAGQELFRTYMVQMTDQGVSDEDLPFLVAYLASRKGP